MVIVATKWKDTFSLEEQFGNDIPYNLATLFLSISKMNFYTCAYGELHKNSWAKTFLIAKREKKPQMPIMYK